MSLDALAAGLGDDWPFETFPEYLDAVERRGIGDQRRRAARPHPAAALRDGRGGDRARRHGRTRSQRMRALVGEAIDAGAVGFATSKSPTHVGYAGRPVPSRLAELDEMRALAGALGDAGAGRHAGDPRPRPALRRVRDRSPARPGRPVSWTALLAGAGGPGSHRGPLERAARQQQAGQQVIPQVSCRPLNFEFQWKEPFPFESMKLFAPDLDAPTSPASCGSTAIPSSAARSARAPRPASAARSAAWWERTVIASVPVRARRSRSARWPRSRASAACTRSIWRSTSGSPRSSTRASASRS